MFPRDGMIGIPNGNIPAGELTHSLHALIFPAVNAYLSGGKCLSVDYVKLRDIWMIKNDCDSIQ